MCNYQLNAHITHTHTQARQTHTFTRPLACRWEKLAISSTPGLQQPCRCYSLLFWSRSSNSVYYINVQTSASQPLVNYGQIVPSYRWPLYRGCSLPVLNRSLQLFSVLFCYLHVHHVKYTCMYICMCTHTHTHTHTYK